MNTIREPLDQYIDQECLHTFEGRRGVVNLVKITRLLGYKDPQYFGSLGGAESLGDLLTFLEDNSGAIEAVVSWIGTQRSTEWAEAIKAELNEEDPE